MKAIILHRILTARIRAWRTAIVALFLVPGMAQAAAIYSTSNSFSASSNCNNPVLCAAAGQGVDNASQAADASLSNFATMYKGIGAASTVSLRLGLAGTGQVGDRAGILVAPAASLLSASALGTYTLVTYLNNVVQETRVVTADVVQSLRLLSDNARPTQLEFVANTRFDEVALQIAGSASLLYTLNVYYAYAVPALVKPQVRGALSRFAATGAGLQPYYGAGTSNAGVVSACVLSGIQNPEAAVDSDLTNYAQFLSAATVGCPPALDVRLAVTQPLPAGYYAGFVVGTSGLLDLGVLSGLRVSTYLNGVATGESATGEGLLELRALPDGKYQVSFPTTQPFNEVKIERIGAITVLDNLRLYYGFGVEPAAFAATTRVLSNFSATSAASYEVTGSGVACVTFSSSCTVINPANAVDANLSNYASINTLVALATSAELKMSLNATGGGAAGNRAGVVMGTGTGLLDASVLDRITISTYDANNNLIESASGRAVLGTNLLSATTQEISFATTQPFARVSISVASGAALSTDMAVYYAFADNRPSGLPTVIAPLPVELTAFAGKWAGGSAELNWATASEKNSAYFVVERSTGADVAFRAVGQVVAAGSSSRPLAYVLRDAEAGTQGVAILYYRLRQVDLDGQQAFSPVVAVAVGKATAALPTLALYPNPTLDAQAVTIHCLNLPSAEGTTVQVYSQMGQLVGQLPVAEGARGLVLPALAPGLYHVVLRDAAGRQLAAQRLLVEGH